MPGFDEQLLTSEDTMNENAFLSQKPTALLHDFKVAIGLLILVCALVTALMHLFVPGV